MSVTLWRAGGDALCRLLRPDRHDVVVSLDSLDLTVADLLSVPRAPDVDDPWTWRAAS